jgi:ElaB/YqjD/DUF883 family membrane-anchored ribosome-binding protein
MNLGKPTKIARLNEQMAIELGASLMGEIIIFSVAGGCLVLEYNRQVTKESKKEDMRQQQLQKFTNDIQALYQMTVKQDSEIEYLRSSLYELTKKTKHKLSDQNVDYNDNIIKQTKQSVINQALSYYNNEVKKKEKPS